MDAFIFVAFLAGVAVGAGLMLFKELSDMSRW